MTVAAGKTPYHSYFPGSAMSAEAIPFEFLAASDLTVRRKDGAVLTEGVDYLVGGDPRTGSATITAQISESPSVQWEIYSNTSVQQQLSLQETRKVPLGQYETELDRAALRARENQFDIERAPKAPRGEAIGDLPTLSQRKGSLLGTGAAVAYAAYDKDGNPTVDTAENFAAPASASADRAETSASFAEEFSGPAYADVAAGEAATTDGQFFRVPNGTVPETYTRYQRTAAGSIEAASLATTVDLDSPDPDKGDALVRVNANETAADIFAQTVRITEYGAKFDVGDDPDIANATDDKAAWDAALEALRIAGGGTLMLPPGASKVTAMIDIPLSVPIRIVGTGTRKVYPGAFTAGTACPSTVVPYHNDRAAFRFAASADGQGEFSAEKFNLATLEGATQPNSGFAWDTLTYFPYGFSFRKMGIHGFKKSGSGYAFEVYKSSGTQNSVGAVLIENCVINRNNWIAKTNDSTQFNGFRFVYNKAGQNGYDVGKGGIDVQGHDRAILNNVLEGQRDAVRLTGGFRDAIVQGNYFEANVGTACVYISGAFSFSVGPNFYGSMNSATLDHKVLLYSTGFGQCIDPYFPQLTHKMPPAQVGFIGEMSLNNTPSGYGLLRLDQFSGYSYTEKPNALSTYTTRPSSPVRDFNPQTGGAIPVQEYTTSASGLVSLSQSISGASGQWAVVCIPFKRIADVGAAVAPYIRLDVNGAGAAGTQDMPAYNYELFWRDGDWVMLTAAIKLGTAMTSLLVNFYPFGVNPAAGRVARFLRPYVYVTDNVNKIRPFMDNVNAETVSGAPTTGTWTTGDLLRNLTGGFYKCTASGTPGTWVAI